MGNRHALPEEAYDATAARHRARLYELLPALLERLQWDRAKLEAHRQERLEDLIRHAREHSPWYAARAAGSREGRVGRVMG